MDQPLPYWRSRDYLPHLESPSKVQALTFRLADSLPTQVLKRLDEELASIPEDQQANARRQMIEAHLDSGRGCCALGHPAMAEVMQEALLFFESDRYHLIAWCIMPNHVHVMVRPFDTLGKIVRSWKSYTAKWAKHHASEIGWKSSDNPFWMREYWDRYMRSPEHFENSIDYIHRNPVKAGLCSTPEDWRWSSARRLGK